MIEYQLQPPLDMVTVNWEREVHKPNRYIYIYKQETFIVVQIINTSSVDNSYHFFQFFWLHWIEKQSSSGRALENLESSGTEIMMVGEPTVHQSCEQETNNEGS